MSVDHDTEPPPPAPETSPELPEEPIAAGKARVAVAAGFLEVLGAMARLESVCAALARALDQAAATAVK